MDRIDNQKKVLKILFFVLVAIASVVTVLFITHIINVKKFNEEWRVITPESTSAQVMVDIHPRGGVTDSWEKNNTGLGKILNAKIYEMVVTNNAHTYVDDWNVRINITENCYLNNGWCGTFEVHQFADNGEELIQTLDLRNFDENEITINHHMGGQDLLIPLYPGDYYIYHPDLTEATGEVPIKGSEDMTGESIIGIIMYSSSGDVDMSEYVLSYRLHKTVWDGRVGLIFIIAFSSLAVSSIILLTIFIVSVRFEERIISQNRILGGALKVCCSLADSRDYYSKEHSERVAEYSKMIAEKIGMDKSDSDVVYNAALLHNIGNTFVSEQVLRKKGKLTRDEFAEVKKHTLKGAEILKEIKEIPLAAEAALYHHEKFDGTGYPEGRKEKDIPLIARIVAVADAYDAMSNDRPYRNKLMREQIREEFIKNRGTQFDPEIVTAFWDIMGERNL